MFYKKYLHKSQVVDDYCELEGLTHNIDGQIIYSMH